MNEPLEPRCADPSCGHTQNSHVAGGTGVCAVAQPKLCACTGFKDPHPRESEAPSEITVAAPEPKEDDIQWPKHYNQGKIQMTDYCLDQKFGACSSAIIKYVTRYRWKGTALKDLKKARWYLDKLISLIEAGGSET